MDKLLQSNTYYVLRFDSDSDSELNKKEKQES